MSIDVFFRKIVGLREKRPMIEQRIDPHPKLDDADRLQLREYIAKAYRSLTTFNVLFADPDDRFVGTAATEAE